MSALTVPPERLPEVCPGCPEAPEVVGPVHGIAVWIPTVILVAAAIVLVCAAVAVVIHRSRHDRTLGRPT
jgi:hypothetical protein